MDVLPRWPAPTSAVLAHAQRVRLRDYLDPVLAKLVAAQWLSASLYLVSAILTGHGSTRGAAAASLAITGLFVLEFVVLSRRRLRQRVRAHTVQRHRLHRRPHRASPGGDPRDDGWAWPPGTERGQCTATGVHGDGHASPHCLCVHVRGHHRRLGATVRRRLVGGRLRYPTAPNQP